MTDFLKPINETHAIMRILCYSLPTRLLSAACIFTVAMAFSARAAGPTTAVAVLHPTKGNQATGIIHFQPVSDGKVRVTATVENLAPNSVHAIHIHEFGDCTAPDATSAGGHYNPEGHPHALPDKKERHAGDLGNLQADAQGKATLDLTVDNITINGSKNPVVGRGVIVHEKKDDGSQPVGNAGGRISCGVIGLAK
ncbi:MAG: superoxide dismutase family protein [Verrucomicrobia bacterium]|nr:MAG: superoxide dismutase family protein [Verrucomicrobiota bacterium]